jgi:hypothetical protein
MMARVLRAVCTAVTDVAVPDSIRFAFVWRLGIAQSEMNAAQAASTQHTEYTSGCGCRGDTFNKLSLHCKQQSYVLILGFAIAAAVILQTACIHRKPANCTERQQIRHEPPRLNK